jgi:hypothetical protein
MLWPLNTHTRINQHSPATDSFNGHPTQARPPSYLIKRTVFQFEHAPPLPHLSPSAFSPLILFPCQWFLTASPDRLCPNGRRCYTLYTRQQHP